MAGCETYILVDGWSRWPGRYFRCVCVRYIRFARGEGGYIYSLADTEANLERGLDRSGND